MASVRERVCEGYFNVDPFPTVQELNEEIRQYILQPSAIGNASQLVPSFTTTCNTKHTSLNSSVVPGQPTHSKVSILESTNLEAVTRPSSAAELMSRIIQSENKLCFIRHQIPSRNRTEWRLVRIELSQSMKENPLTLTNGRVLVTFFISHPNDSKFNPINRRFWIQYHQGDGIRNLSEEYHLIRPHPNEESYCKQHFLRPYQEWVNLHDEEIFILGPFNFTVINNRKTRDRIDETIWRFLRDLKPSVNNTIPVSSPHLQGFICHANTPFHGEYKSESTTIAVRNALAQAYLSL